MITDVSLQFCGGFFFNCYSKLLDKKKKKKGKGVKDGCTDKDKRYR